MPTRRNDKNFHIFNYGFLPKIVEEFAKINKFHFFISHHPTNMNHNITNYKLKKIHLINLDGNLIDDALNNADLLVTDYSSIFADYLILTDL